jgi:cell division protein FtsW
MPRKPRLHPRAAALLAHLRGDRTIWMVAFFLVLISLLAVYSSISSLAYKRGGGSFYFLAKHGLMLASGLAITWYTHRMGYTIWSRLSQLLIGVVVAMLALTLLMGSNINDASRWMRIPGVGLSFQTSDLAKVVLILYVSRSLSKDRERLADFRTGALRVMLPIVAVCGLILPANFSTAALLFAVCMVLLIIGRIPLHHMALIGVLSLGLLASLWGVSKVVPGALPRMETWISRLEHFGDDDRDANYQVDLAKSAIACGGLLPNGPGSGTSRNFLPHPYSDMIYAFIVEEYGSLLGGLGLLLLYLILLLRAVRIALRCEKLFGQLVAMGLSLSLVLQALVNMAVAVNLVPVTGQPLPLVSMGGTSIWFTCLAIGIVLSISASGESATAKTTAPRRGSTTKAEQALA